MKPNKSHKMCLSRETLRALDSGALAAVAGGAANAWSLFTGVCKTCTNGCGSGDPQRTCNPDTTIR